MFSYDDWLHLFHISVNWRLIYSDLSEWENLPKHHREAAEDARDIWHDIILNDESVHEDPFTHHMVLLSDLELRTDPSELPDRWEFYRDRAIDATVVHGAGTHYYVKLPKVAFITCIQPPYVDGFSNTEIEESGRIRTPQRIPRDIENFLVQRGILVLERTASQQSQEKILKRMLENPEQTLESGSFRAHAESMKRQIENHNPLDYLDQECEVCFTDHRIIESLPERPIEKVELEGWPEKQDEWDGKFVYFEPIYFEDGLTHEDLSETATATLVFGTEDTVVQIALYNDAGWVVEKEIGMTDRGDPVEMAKLLHEETRSGYVEFVNQQQ